MKGTREVVLSKFYLGYKKLDLELDEIVTAIKIPRLLTKQGLRLYKVSMRKDLDISAVTFAGVIEIENKKIKALRLALGGVAATVVRLDSLEKKYIGADFSETTFKSMVTELPTLVSPLSDLRASKEYRMKLCQNYFMKFFHEISGGV